MESFNKVSLLQRTKSKYILGEILSFTFYCHQGHQLLSRLNKESYNLLKNDDYLIKIFKKEVREVLLFGNQEHLETLSKMNFTYDYRIVLYENNMIPLMQQAQIAFLSKPKNINSYFIIPQFNFDFESFVINRNQFWQINIGSNLNGNGEIQEDQRIVDLYLEQLTKELIDVKCLTQLRKLQLSNSEMLFIPFAEFLQKYKKKTKLQTLKIHSYIQSTALPKPQIISGFNQLMDSALRYHNIQELVIQWLYIDKQVLQELVESLQLAQNLIKFDITIDIKDAAAQINLTGLIYLS